MEKTSSRQQTIYGLRPVIEAIVSGARIERVLIQNGLNSSLLNELRTKIKEQDIPFQYVPVEKLNKMTSGNHQGVVAVIGAVKYHSLVDILEQLAESEAPLLVLLDHVTDWLLASAGEMHKVVLHHLAIAHEDVIGTRD